MGRVVYFNGEFVPESEAKISIYDSALMFGDMVFEMTRSFGKKQFMLREHVERLFKSMKYVHIDCKMTIEEVEQACLLTIEKNDPLFSDHDEHRLMINVSRGPLALYSEVFNHQLRPTVVIADFPLKWTVASMAPLFETGVNAVVPSQRNIPSPLLEGKVKNRSRIHYLMANVEVSRMKGENNWALLLDPDGFVSEGTGSNFFIVKNGKLLTPEPRNILRGISRDYIFSLGKQLGLEVIETNIEPYDVLEASEAFMSATPFCIVPVTSFNGVKISDGMGPTTRLLLKTWSQNVGLDIVEQIKAYGQEVSKLNQKGTTPYEFKR